MTHGNHFNSTLHYLHVTVMSINFDLYDFYVLPTLLGDIDFWSVHQFVRSFLHHSSGLPLCKLFSMKMKSHQHETWYIHVYVHHDMN